MTVPLTPALLFMDVIVTIWVIDENEFFHSTIFFNEVILNEKMKKKKNKNLPFFFTSDKDVPQI